MLSQDEKGRTKLYLAASNNRIEEAKKMMKEANNINIVSELVNKASSWGNTPLYIASAYGHLQMAQLLITNGAEIDKADINDWTPLITASRQDHLEVVKLLIEHQADVHLKDEECKTALDHARKYGHPAVEKALRKAGATYTGFFDGVSVFRCQLVF